MKFCYCQQQKKRNKREEQRKSRNAAASGRDLLDRMGDLFYADFSSVKVSKSSRPRQNGMAAFTEAGNVYIDDMAPAESSIREREILGHELSHVVQQTEGRTPHRAGSGQEYYWQKDLEEEADRWGKMAARDERVRTGSFLAVDVGSIADCPRQPMLLHVRDTQYETTSPEQLQQLTEDLDSMDPDDWFALSEQMYKCGAPFKEDEKRLQRAIDAKIVAWQTGLKADNPDKFSGEDSKKSCPEPALIPEPGNTPGESLPDIPLMGPTREKMPGQDTFPSRGELVDILAGGKQRESLTYPVHRGEMETEFYEIGDSSVPCVRIYLTVYKQCDEFIAKEDGTFLFKYKDIRQKEEDGRIVISGGGHDKMYMNAGRPLRALQWADKYRAENKAVRAEPVIYSFLFPLERFNDLTRNAINQQNKRDFPDRVENSDFEAAPNQFELPVDIIQEGAVPGTLISYSENTAGIVEGGEVLPASSLRKKLGVPELTLKKSMWIDGEGFRSGKDQKIYAKQLSGYLMLWQKYCAGRESAYFNESLLRGFPIREQGHIPVLRKFLEENNLIRPDQGNKHELNLDEPQINRISWFMRNVVSPWANLGAAVGLLRDDYIHLFYDTEVGPVSGRDTNNFGRQSRAEHAEAAGIEIDRMVQGNAGAVEIINDFLRMCPELMPAFEEISNRPEKYSFYDHVQLVLQKYMQLIQGEPDEGRILSHASVVKSILFHDLYKWSSRMQYTQEGQMEESAAEHYLPYLEMGTYRKLWGEDPRQLRGSRALINGDPIGTFLKSGDGFNSALDEIALMAERAGLAYGEYFQFFKELVQFYMADFASYTSTGRYAAEYGKEPDVISKGTFDKMFIFDGEKGGLLEMQDEILGIKRFRMCDEYEQKLMALEQIFRQNQAGESMRELIQQCRQEIIAGKTRKKKR